MADDQMNRASRGCDLVDNRLTPLHANGPRSNFLVGSRGHLR